MQNIDEKIIEVTGYAKTVLRESRYQHSLRVGEYARYLAKLYKDANVCHSAAYFAGIAHDICKHFSDEELLKITEEDGLGVDSIEKKRLNLLHGRASAIVLKNKFGVTDESILKAVAFHTFGYEDIDNLGKIIFIADKIEPGRGYEVENLRMLAGKISLNELMIKVIDDRAKYIINHNGSIHDATKKMYERIKREELK